MTEEHALLASVLSNPKDDLPRLILADWWEENKQPERAEFCRVQVELARRGDRMHDTGQPGIGGKRVCKCGGYPCETCNELRRRERELLRHENSSRWILPGGSLVGWANSCCEIEALYDGKSVIRFAFSRGFISSVRCSWQDWLRVESRLVWVPGGTVECRYARGLMCHIPIGGILCTNCSGSGRIPRPFYESMHPVETVELTSPYAENPNRSPDGRIDWFVMPDLSKPGFGHRFDREKCQKCGGRGFVRSETLNLVAEHCPDCHGRPLNSWKCDSWPLQRFKMPKAAAEPRRASRLTTDELRDRLDMPLGQSRRPD